jgi:hypothetical protein
MREDGDTIPDPETLVDYVDVGIDRDDVSMRSAKHARA